MSRCKILFICTGNIFRSMTAELGLRAALGPGSDVVVRSAGLIDAPHEIVSFVKGHLATRGLDVSQHKPRRLTRAMLAIADLPVAMGIEHRDQIIQEFDRALPMFSEIAYGTQEPLPDVSEVVPEWRSNEAAAAAYGRSVMDYIIDGMPGFVGRMHAFMPTGLQQR